MTDSVYQSILKPLNSCPLMGMERIVKSEAMGEYRVTVSVDNFKQYRVMLRVRVTDEIVSSILFDQNRIVRFKYTVQAYRNLQFTRQLFAYVQVATRKTFYHSDNLTVSGAASIA